ncbi:MATE family efflux transporter, partial [Lishizhenia sp.]|uniref:MATE family efflux transporter n=1 Tax=Lishizhenia sp. TaxID=2497594 RepID=UPI00299EE8FD
IFTFLIFHGALLYPEQLISVVNSKEEYLPESARILRMVFGSILIFGCFTPFFQTINGSGNTRVTLIIEITSIIIYLICAYLFVKVWQFEIFNVWFVEYIYFGSLSILSIGYLKFFNWQQKVI